MKFKCSLIVVEDIIRARDFYERILDQTVELDYGENIVFKGGYAIHKKDHFKKLIMNNTIVQKSNNFELYFEHDLIDEIIEKLKKENVEFIHEVMEQPWKQRVIRFYDPDNNIIEIGESMEMVAYRLHKEKRPIDEIAEITYLSEESIESIIRKYS